MSTVLLIAAICLCVAAQVVARRENRRHARELETLVLRHEAAARDVAAAVRELHRLAP